MIYIIKLNESPLLKVTENKITTSNKIFKLLYTLDWKGKTVYNDVINNLRSWNFLSMGESWFRENDELKKWIETNKFLKNPPEVKLRRVWESDISSLIKNFENNYVKLLNLGLIDKKISFKKDENLLAKIKYSCDITNYLKELYTENVVSLVKDYISLEQKYKDFLIEMNKAKLREDKFKLFKNLIETEADKLNLTILKFIPDQIKINYLLTDNDNNPLYIKTYRKDENVNLILPMFRNLENCKEFNMPYVEKKHIKSIELSNRIFCEFKLGELYKGTDIKDRLRKIYSSINFEKSPLIKDLKDYFSIVRKKSDYYRIDYRKVI